MGIDRVSLFSPDVSRNVRGTWGTYVEKNPNQAGDFDNSGMYIQTSTEPWNGLPGFTVAYNDSSFNLAFNPNDNTSIKTSTWDPSLNANDFWNVKIPDNSGQPVLWRAGGGNTIKTYIDDSIESQSDYDLSKVLHEMYKHQFVCASVKKKGDWYIFSGHRWEMMEEDTELYNKISFVMRFTMRFPF